MSKKNLLSVYSKVIKNDENRNENDFYPTPPIATFSLLKELQIPTKKVIIEPCSGEGWISKECQVNGHDVKAFDLYPYDKLLVDTTFNCDFMTLPKQDADILITNPPYRDNMPERMAEKAIEEYDLVAMLLRITFLESNRRYRWFQNYRPKYIFGFADRLGFEFKNDLMNLQNKGMINYAWFIWNKNWLKEDHSIFKSILSSKYMPEWREKNAPKYFKDGEINYDSSNKISSNFTK